MDYNKEKNSENLSSGMTQYLSLLKSAFQQDVGSWEKPWIRSARDFHPQSIDGNYYKGSNLFWTILTCCLKGYKTPVFLTYNRALDEGCHVKKGESCHWLSYSHLEKFCPTRSAKELDPTLRDLKEKEYRALSPEDQAKYYPKVYSGWTNVFNLDQTNMAEVDPKRYQEIVDHFKENVAEKSSERVDIPCIDTMIQNQSWICPIHLDQTNKAFYSPLEKQISVPPKQEYKFDSGFYRTLVHEMVHSTSDLPDETVKVNPGEEPPLVRTFDYSDTPQRAREELVAEFGSGMVMIELGLDAKLDPNNQAYLKFWGEKLSNASDKELIEIIQDCDKAANIIFDKGLKLDRKQAKEQGVNFSRFNGEEYTQHLAEKHAKEKEKGNNKTTKWKASSTKSNARSSYRSKKY